MRKIITIACSKGGVGKSTIALNLAIELNRQHAVTVLDLDYQKSATLFNKIRKSNGLEPLNIVRAENDKALKKIVKENAGILIIDTGAFDSDLNRMAILLSDMVITPISDSEVEIYGLLMFNEYLKSMKKAKPSLKAHVLINHLPPRASTAEIINQVKDNNKTLTLLKTVIKERNDYRHIFTKGQGVTEATKKREAATEIIALAKEVLK